MKTADNFATHSLFSSITATMAALSARAMRRPSAFGAAAIVGALFITSASHAAQVVISQIYNRGGVSGSTYNGDFVEIHNRGQTAVNINGWSLQFAQPTSSTWVVRTLSSVDFFLQPGQYWLHRSDCCGTGGALPGFDSTGALGMLTGGGKLALVNSSTTLTGTCPLPNAAIQDFFGYGTANCFEGTVGASFGAVNSASYQRLSAGCVDNNDNGADFEVALVGPRNSTSGNFLCSPNATDQSLFISEYVEGTGNNKALEIYNALSVPVDLAADAYKILIYANTGGGFVTGTINLTGTILPGGAFVLTHSSAGATLLALANQTSSSLTFDGNDAVALVRGASDTPIDNIGQIGGSPGAEWGAGLISTADNTLRRMPSICVGDPNGNNGFNPTVEWNGFATDTFYDLGVHTAACGVTPPPIFVTATVGTLGPTYYQTLAAAFAAINAGTHKGVVAIRIVGDTTESATATLGASGGASSYTSITIQPLGSAAQTITGSIGTGPMIDLNGADNVTIDGLNANGNSLTISNTSTSATSTASTIRFIGGATNNTVTNCSVLGSTTMQVATNGATIYFSTDANTANGNDNNTISNCNIGPAGSNLPTKGILGNGSITTTAIGNSGIIIDNNNIFDYFGPTVTSSGIAINGGCNTWSITNNRLYQSGARTWTSGQTHRAIDLNSTTVTSGVQGMTVTGNIIGYASNTQTGAYTLTGSTGKFQGIVLNGINGGTVSNINSNTVASVSLTGVTSSGTGTSAPFIGIFINNGVAITNSNTVGSLSATGSLTFSTNTTTSTNVLGMYNFSNDNWTSTGNNIGGISVTNAGASGTFVVYGILANTTNVSSWTATSNLVGGTVANSIQLTATGTTSQVIGMHSVLPQALFTSNQVRSMTTNIGTGTTLQASMIGILISPTASSHTLSQNTIFNLSNTNATAASAVMGVHFTGGTANVIERNLIYGLTAATTSASAQINGMRMDGGTTIFRNNMIAIGAGVNNAIGAAAANSGTLGVCGINDAGGTNSFFHNSMYIGGSPTAGTGASYCFNVSTTSGSRIVRDNILHNARSNSGATGKNYAVKINGTTPNPSGLTINNNVYFTNGTGGVFGFFNSADVANLTAWKTAVGQDAASFESNPQYNSPGGSTPDLHINPSSPTVVEASGVDVGVTDDYDGQTRASFTPVDIGADAGNFAGVDFTPPSISYSALGNTISTTARTLQATITDSTGVPTTGIGLPRLYAKINSGSYSGVTATSLGSGIYEFTFGGGVAAGDVVSYYVVAQDTAATPNVTCSPLAGASGFTVNPPAASTPPTSPSSYLVLQSFRGNYTIGAGGSYTNLTTAIAALNSGIITSPVTFTLVAGYPASAETFPININANSGSSVTNTVTIKPGSGQSPVISGSSTGCLININGADYVTIDGSNNGTSSRDMTISNTNTGTSSACVCLTSLGAGLGATNNVVKNINVVGTSITGTDRTLAGIFSGSATISNASAGADNDSNTIQNNSITKTAYGVYCGGASAANKNTGTIITGNVMNAASPSNITTGGILVNYEDGIQISQNDIAVLKHDGTAGTTNTAFGIALGVVPNNTVTTFTGSDVTNAVVFKNEINGITQLNSTGYSAFGIVVNTVTSGTTLLVNNMISGVRSAATASDFSAGIVAGGGAGSTTQVFFNTVSMTGARGAATYPSYGLALGGSNPTIDARDNILYNIQTSSGSGKSYAIGTASSTFTGLTSDYNDLFTSATATLGQTGGLGTAGIDRTFATWKTTTGTDTNSNNVDPLLASTTDLHLQYASTMLGAAITIGSVTDDFDGEARNAATAIGADDILCTGPVIAVEGHPSSQSVCSGGMTTFHVTATGTAPLSYQWRQGSNNLTNTPPFSGALTDTLTINPATSSEAAFDYNCVVTNACGSTTSSNASLTVNSAPSGVVVTPASSSSCAYLQMSVSASGTAPLFYQWRRGTTNIVDGGNVSGAQTANLLINPAEATYTGADYNCVVSNACGTANSNNASFTFVPILQPNGASASPNPVCTTPGSMITLHVSDPGNGGTLAWYRNACGVAQGGTFVGNGNDLEIAAPGSPTTYFARMETPCGNTNCASVTVTINTTPIIERTGQPAPVTVCDQDSAVLHVTVTAALGTRTYQWHNGPTVVVDEPGHISGAQTATLTINPVDEGDEGPYYVIVTNGCGSVTSQSADLTVHNEVAGVDAQPANQSVCEGSGATVTVTTASGSAPLSYQWWIHTPGGDVMLVDGPTHSGTQTPMMQIVRDNDDSEVVFCRVTNDCGSSNSNDATINVTPLTTWYADGDADTYGNLLVTQQACTQPIGYVSNSDDCNDANGDIHPGAPESCNGDDDDCDGLVDEGAPNDSVTWTGGAGTNLWHDDENWSTHQAPTACSDVFINHGGVVVVLDGADNVTVHSVTVGATLPSTLSMMPGASLTVTAGTLEVEEHGVLRIELWAGLPPCPPTTVNASIRNKGINEVLPYAMLHVTGSLTAKNGGTVRDNRGNVVIDGALTLESGSTMEIHEGSQVTAGQFKNLLDSDLNFVDDGVSLITHITTPELEIQGTMTVVPTEKVEINGAVMVGTTGSCVAGANSEVTVSGACTLATGAEMEMHEGTQLSVTGQFQSFIDSSLNLVDDGLTAFTTITAADMDLDGDVDVATSAEAIFACSPHMHQYGRLTCQLSATVQVTGSMMLDSGAEMECLASSNLTVSGTLTLSSATSRMELSGGSHVVILGDTDGDGVIERVPDGLPASATLESRLQNLGLLVRGALDVRPPVSTDSTVTTVDIESDGRLDVVLVGDSSFTCSSSLHLQPLGGDVTFHADGASADATVTCGGTVTIEGGDFECRASSGGNIAAVLNGNTVIGAAQQVRLVAEDASSTVSLETGPSSVLRGTGAVLIDGAPPVLVSSCVVRGQVSPGVADGDVGTLHFVGAATNVQDALVELALGGEYRCDIHENGQHDEIELEGTCAIETRDTLKTYFENGDIPTQDQFFRVIHATLGAEVDTGATFSSIVLDGHPECMPTATYSLTEVVLHTGSSLWYSDADADGHGDMGDLAPVASCNAVPGRVANADDCDDGDSAVHPGAMELCNGTDDDCDGDIDEGVSPTTWYQDSDGDTYGNAAVTQYSCELVTGYVLNADDCDDTNAAVHPGAAETCNGIDDDCDSVVDNGAPAMTWYQDADSDSFGNPLATQQACAQPPGYVADQTDCDDTNDLIHPGAAEICNGLDDNCNGPIDEGLMALPVTLQLPGGETTNRCIRFTIHACASAPSGVTIQQMVPFNGGSASTMLSAPCDATCITAMDVKHSLRQTTVIENVSGALSATFGGSAVLIGGNVNGDNVVDILDFGGLTGQYNQFMPPVACGTLGLHCDISGDGHVGTDDFTFIQIGFLQTHSENCCGQPGLAGANSGGVEQISVEALWATGRGQLTAGDVNHDGWVDALDIAAMVAGMQPDRLSVYENNLAGSWFDSTGWANALVPDITTLAVAAEGSTILIDRAGAMCDRMIIRPSAKVRILGSASLTAGIITIQAGGVLAIDDLALLEAVDLNVEPGASLVWQGGRVRLTGDYQQGGHALLDVTVHSFGREPISVGGTITLDGRLTVSMIASTSAQDVQAINLLQGGQESVSGAFDSVTVTRPGGAKRTAPTIVTGWTMQYGDDFVSLVRANIGQDVGISSTTTTTTPGK